MAWFKIKSGERINVLTKDEMEEYFNKEFKRFYGHATYMKIPWSSKGANLPVTIPGPEVGFTWSVKLISAQLSVSAQLFVYTDDDTDSNLEDHDSAVQQHALRYTSNTLVINGGQVIILETGGTAASGAGIIRVKQVPVGFEHLL